MEEPSCQAHSDIYGLFPKGESMALWIGDYPDGWHHVNVKNRSHKKTVNQYTHKPAGNEKVQP